MGIVTEPILTLTEACKRLPGRPSVSTLHRWRTHGVRGIRLRTAKVGGRRVVTLSDLEEFCAAVTAASDGDRQPAPRSSRRRQNQIARAEAELSRLGIGDRHDASSDAGVSGGD